MKGGKQFFKKRKDLCVIFIPVIREKKDVDRGKAFTVVALEFWFLLFGLNDMGGLLKTEMDLTHRTDLKSLDIAYDTLRYISFERKRRGQ